MRKERYLPFAFLLITFCVSGQYTEIINSNRPGVSMSAFSVGKNVLQGEVGFFMERQEHTVLLTESNFIGTDFALRYGFLMEQLEVIWAGVFQQEKITRNAFFPPFTSSQSNFSEHTIGIKYLIYDPYKTYRKVNLYSWKANHDFQWKDLIPAVSLYAGMNLTSLGDNPFWPEDNSLTPRISLMMQQHFGSRWVLVSNITYDRFTTDDPVFNYVITLTHALKNPKWSIFAEHQGFQSNAYADGIFRGGAARLLNKNFQIDATFGINIKDTPSRLFGNIGFSYRLDYHKN